jgi:WhiB family transcriptional regulator, redox-sensing transcriptional regulator
MERPIWSKKAVCRGMDPDLFYPVDGKLTIEAKIACHYCPVRDPCLEYGLADPFGIWGGMTPTERGRIVRRREAGAA